jgi:hypothetical protein
MPSLSTCISLVSRLLPLETALGLPPPARWAEEEQGREVERRRTWRVDGAAGAGRRDDVEAVTEDEIREGREGRGWTAWDVMEGWALERGYSESLTAVGIRLRVFYFHPGFDSVVVEGILTFLWCCHRRS